VRCPREVKITELMHSLEILATYHHLTSRRTHTPAMYRYFVNSIKANGRVHEFGFMMRYYLSTNPFSAIKIAPVGINMLRRGRLSLRAEKIKGRDQLKAIREKAQALGGV
jgi:heterodisulfide reductase subunit C